MATRRKAPTTTGYSVYDSRGRRIAGGVDREVAMRVKEDARRRTGDGNVTVIRHGQDKSPGPRSLDP